MTFVKKQCKLLHYGGTKIRWCKFHVMNLLPFLPITKFTFELNLKSNTEWHMKFLNSMDSTIPTSASLCNIILNKGIIIFNISAPHVCQIRRYRCKIKKYIPARFSNEMLPKWETEDAQTIQSYYYLAYEWLFTQACLLNVGNFIYNWHQKQLNEGYRSGEV